MLIIKPFIFLIEFLLSVNFNIIHNYGLSLILLSFEITALMLPFFYLAEKWKRSEEKAQFLMENDLNSIKEVYTGQKRFYLIKEVHRIHNYKSIYSLRVTFGLLIQIPFFMAAYIYLSSFSGLNNISFGPVFDLGRQDQLLKGVNLLPFLMTFVNIYASYLYAKDGKRNDKIQLVIFAVLFLILLYDRPAGLLLYWTMNNVFSIPKNLWLKKIFPPLKTFNEEKNNLKKILKSKWTPSVIWLASLFILINQTLLIDKKIDYAKETVLFSAAAGGLLSLVFFIRWIIGLRKKETSFIYIILPLICWACFLFICVDKFINGPLSIGYEVAPLWFFMFFMQMIIASYTAHFILKKEDFPVHNSADVISNQDRKIYFLSSIFLCFFFFMFSPVISYLNGGSMLRNTVSDIIIKNFPVLLTSLAFSLLIYFIFKKKHKNLIIISFLFVLMTIIYFYILPTEGGGLNFNFLMDAKALNKVPVFFYLLDFMIITACYFTVVYLSERYKYYLIVFLFSILIAVSGEFTFKILSSDINEVKTTKNSNLLPDESDFVHSFSKKEKNILMIVPDMFVGGYIEDIKKDSPEVIKTLNGFTWYPNTLSISTRTYTSMPSILGGKKYTPDGLNENKIEFNDKKSNDAYYEVVVPLAEHGWSVSLTDPYLSLKDSRKELLTETKSEFYMPYWAEINNDNLPDLDQNNSFILSMFSIFHSAPYSLKKTIYSKGLWIFSSRKESQKYTAIENQIMWSYLDLLPSISNTNSINPTFKYIHSEMTHHPFAVDKYGDILYDSYPDEEAKSNVYGKSAYYSAKEFIRLLSDFVSWMKKEDIYDNTMIIIVSDHGNTVTDDDPFITEDIKDKVGITTFSILHPLLMVKDFNSTEPFSEDFTFMTNADTASIISSAVDFIDSNNLKIERPITASQPYGKYRHFYNFKVCEYNQWEVHDSIFKSENWKRKN